MNKEVYYEGWLIKSPPTKRIWRARWRRRWFTLKQGEIPEQFCLEYYADRKCRKLKGVIDLDQCEQVDCGLRLENRKQKFQFMFDIKTPKRTYYLAADTEQDMRDWVNCICQVCHLHDTKQQPDENHSENVTTATVATNSSNDTTSTTLNTSTISSGGGGVVASVASSSLPSQISFRDVLHKPSTVIDQQPTLTVAAAVPTASVQNNNDSAYVNTEYTNRETLVCDAQFEQRHLQHQQQQQQQQKSESAAINNKLQTLRPAASTASPSAALYLNAAAFQQQEPSRLAVNVNGVVRKIPENLVLNNTPLTVDQQSSSVQPSPALSTASGPYIPISECFSGSPKFMVESNNPTTPLNNLDPKFYDTPRSHNNIGLNLTNDQSYSPKITNCGTQQPVTMTKNRNQQRSDSDSESVFTDDDEWTHPLPLREHLDRNTRPSDSSVENESFVLTYSQRFSKLPEDLMTKEVKVAEASEDGMDHSTKVLKNKNNLILDIRTTKSEKTTRDLPQFSDTENTSPAFIGPRDARSVVEESYDIPRSHQLPYYNMSQLMEEKILSPVNDHNPMAASTPNLRHEVEMAAVHSPGHLTSQVCVVGQADADAAVTNVRTLPRAHCYTNAAPTKVEGNVFRYDFMEQGEVPPVNRKLKPKSNIETDKSPEELPAKPPGQIIQVENFNCKMQSVPTQAASGQTDNVPLKPPSVDRKSKPNVFKVGQSNTLVRRSTGAPFAMVLANDAHAIHALETRTLPRQPRPNYAFGSVSGGGTSTTSPHTTAIPALSGFTVQHQRTASANAAVQLPATTLNSCPQSVANNQNLNLNVALNQLQLQLPPKSEHKLQYFDLDVANAPPINRQSLSVSNLNIAGTNRLTLAADLTTRPPVQSSVVYNSVDFVKTEAFKRIREERKKENEGVSNSGK